MIDCVKAIARCIFSVLNHKFNAGDISFSIWNIIMTFLICSLVGTLLYYFIRGIAESGDE